MNINQKGFTNIALIIVVVAIVAVGGYFAFVKKSEPIDQQQTPTPTTSNNQSDELVKTKFELAMLNFWQVDQVFRDPQNKNKFYYLTNDDSGSNIWVYDLAKDKTYKQDGTFNFNIPEGNTLLLSQKIAKYHEFRGVGILNNKFIFIETNSDNSPGPCFSPWLSSNLEYIDIGISEPTRKPFTLPADLKTTEEQKVSDCDKTL